MFNKISRLPRLAAPAILWLSAATLSVTLTQAQSTLTRHVRPAVVNGQAQFLGAMPASQSLRLDVVLPLRNQPELDQLAKDIYDPRSASYRHFLSPSEFSSRFGPTQEDYDAVASYLTANGLRVVGGSREGTDLQVEGPISAIESAFNVRVGIYQHPTESRTFYAPDREPSVNLGINLWHVSGLDNFSTPHAKLANRADGRAVVSHAGTGSGPSGSYYGSDLRAAYYAGTGTGSGQNVGLFEFLGTDLTDLQTYYTNVGQTYPASQITLLSTDGTSTTCVYSKRHGCDDTEQTLDMTQILGMAPAANLTVFIGSTDTAILASMTTHTPLARSISCSWGWTPADPSADNPFFEQMAVQGQNFFAASGDYSTWTAGGNAEAWPADNAYVVSVGGTDLVTLGPALSWSSETAWSDSGGGPSPDNIPIPYWQQPSGVINSSNRGSTTLRNGPDVAANANFNYFVCADQEACTANVWGGTSFAAPAWGGYLALVNEAAGSPLGFINPAIYSIGASSNYDTNFHDISGGTSGNYWAVQGYDLVTGWGSPNGATLTTTLPSTPAPAGFAIAGSPTSVSVSRGSTGTTTIAATTYGGFNGNIGLSATGQPSGVTVSFSSSTISGAGTSKMTIAVGSNASTGSYTITVTGTGGGNSHTATVSLRVAH